LPAVGDAHQPGGLGGVGGRRLEDLQDVAGHRTLGERERGDRVVERQAPDQVEDLPGLRRRHPGVAVDGPAARPLVGLDGDHQRRPPFSWPAWDRNVRVGANSPSLWPTIDSVMYTGTCLRPSCTAMVWPIMSGMIVDRRDHVLMTDFSPFSLRPSTFFRRWSSTKGPFLRLRGMCGYLREPRVRRRRTMYWSDGLFLRRVRPSVLPQGEVGWRPPEVLPSPPPCGWST